MSAGLPRTLVGCSAKSYFDLAAARAWGPAVLAGAADPEGLFVCPAHPLIPLLAETFGAAGGLVGAQDVSVHPPGAFTGEVSAQLLAELDVRLVMAGHPERRRLCGETDDIVRRKVAATAAAGMSPLLVVGEQVEGEPALPAVAAQLDAWLGAEEFPAGLVVAYEPAWAIGRAEPAPAEHVVQVVRGVRGLLADRGGEMRVLYGGSAQPDTYSALAAATDGDPDALPDGVFMARFGLDPTGFLTVVDEVRTVRSDQLYRVGHTGTVKLFGRSAPPLPAPVSPPSSKEQT